MWVTRVGVPSFIVTLAGLLYFRGISMIITNGATVSPVPEVMQEFGNDSLGAEYSVAIVVGVFLAYAAFRVATARRANALGLITDLRPTLVRSLLPAAVARGATVYIAAAQGLPYLVLLLGVAAIAAEILMRRTVYGPQLYAIGGNPEAARLAGINVAGRSSGLPHRRRRVRADGHRAHLPGQRRRRRAVPGSVLELDAIAAAIIGGTSLAGGRGTISAPCSAPR